jgi:hypothetical protein
MPITAGLSPLQSLINASQNTGVAGSPSLSALQLTSAIASIAPMGIMMLGPTPTPLVPAAFGAMQQMLLASYQSGVSGAPSVSSQQIATAISVLVPLVPPIGISILQSMISSMDNIGIAGNSSLTAQLLASAIIIYFTSGGAL